MSKKYFNIDGKKLLQTAKYRSSVNKYLSHDDLNTILQNEATGNYQFALRSVNAIKFGYYKDNQFIFAKANDKISEKYLLTLRLFNESEEIFIQKINNSYHVRTIKDEKLPDKVEEHFIEAVDNSSRFFGERQGNIENNFVKIAETGRKMEFILPVNEEAKHYDLTTRSYITYDDQTGQAGYGYYRYVEIAAERGNK